MTYSDVLVRDTWAETSTNPSGGALYQSPDIIPYGTGSLTSAQLSGTYAGPDQGRVILSPGVNNIYVRGKNYQLAGTNSGSVALYYANAALLLTPNQWLPNQIGTATPGVLAPPLVNGSGSQQLNPNDIVTGQQPFLLQGLPNPGIHYCLVAVVQTPNHPIAVPTSFASNAAFAQWVQSNPGVAWRNLTLIPNPVPQIVSTFGFSTVNSTPAYFYFAFTGRGFPTGSPLVAQCASPLMPFQYNLTLPAPDANGNQITGFQQQLPAQATGGLNITVSAPAGQQLPVGATLLTKYYQVPAGTEELDVAMSRSFDVVTEESPGAHTMATVSLIELGACTIAVGTAP